MFLSRDKYCQDINWFAGTIKWFAGRIKPDTRWKKILKMNAGNPFICHFTPSNIAYVLAIIKNGQEMWDQAKNPSTSPEKKLRGLRYKLRMMGIPLTGPSYIYGDNKSQVTNSTRPESTLKKKCKCKLRGRKLL